MDEAQLETFIQALMQERDPEKQKSRLDEFLEKIAAGSNVREPLPSRRVEYQVGATPQGMMDEFGNLKE